MSSTSGHHENWNVHQTTMFSSLHEKQKLGKFCDVLLKCSDSEHMFNAHSCVLSSASHVLDKLLQEAMDSNSSASGTKLLVFLPDDIESSCMESLLNFIYSGNIDLSLHKNVQKEVPVTRKSKRNASTSKGKVAEEVSTEEHSDDMSSLYAFLKASRCLEIHTLTEHLESAATLSEMKTREQASSNKLRRTSVTKLHAEEKSKESSSGEIQSPKTRKKKQQVIENKPATDVSRRKSLRRKSDKDDLVKMIEVESDQIKPVVCIEKLPDNVTHDRSGVENLEMDHSETPAVAPDTQKQMDKTDIPPPNDKYCNKCQQTFKTKNAARRHTCTQNSEQLHQVDSFPLLSKSNKKIQCQTCEKTFTSQSVYELHIKKHLDQVEEAKNDQTSAATITEPDKPSESISEISLDVASSSAAPEIPVVDKRPKRTSALKFQFMMQETFGLENQNRDTSDGLFKSPKRKKKQNSVQKVTPSKVNVTQQQTNPDTKTSETNTLSKLPEALNVQNQHLPTNEENVVIEKMDVAELVTVESQQQENNSTAELENEFVHEMQAVVPITPNIIEETRQIHTVDDQAASISLESAGAEIQNLPEGSQGTEDIKMNITDHGGTYEACEVCGEVFTTGKMHIHMKKHEKVTLKCTVCGHEFKYKAKLARHYEKFHSGDGYPCPICNERLYSQKEFSYHLGKHNTKKMRTECPECKRSFTSHYVMELHRKTHSGEERYPCKVCGKKFPYHSSLKMHLLLHTGERPYMCSVCGKSFVQKIHAKEHELQHAGIRRFQCHLCERFFAHKCGLTRHIEDIHNKSRPYICETCGKSFPRKTKLIEHTRMHTGEKPYICNICGIRYKANRSLKCHKKNRHNIYVPDYQVGIWKGPLPPEDRPPSDDERPTMVSFEGKGKQGKTSQPPTTFAFPVLTETVADADKDEECIINNIATEVDVIATEVAALSPRAQPDSPTLKEDSPRQYTYQIVTTTSEYQPETVASYTTIAEGHNYHKPVLPPASTLTNIDPATLVYPIPRQKFIVPLTSTANSALPIIAEQSQFGATQAMPGMMVTYMVPQQVTTITQRVELTPVNIPENLVANHASRSASVPPMSTFARNSVTEESGNQTTVKQTLPGMHTLQPVRIPASQAGHTVITGYGSRASSVVVPLPPIPVNQEVVETQQSSEWSSQE